MVSDRISVCDAYAVHTAEEIRVQLDVLRLYFKVTVLCTPELRSAPVLRGARVLARHDHHGRGSRRIHDRKQLYVGI